MFWLFSWIVMSWVWIGLCWSVCVIIRWWFCWYGYVSFRIRLRLRWWCRWLSVGLWCGCVIGSFLVCMCLIRLLLSCWRIWIGVCLSGLMVVGVIGLSVWIVWFCECCWCIFMRLLFLSVVRLVLIIILRLMVVFIVCFLFWFGRMWMCDWWYIFWKCCMVIGGWLVICCWGDVVFIVFSVNICL